MNAAPFKPEDKIATFNRYSEGDEQGLKNQSTEEQADMIRDFCSRNSIQLVQGFSDPIASDKSVAKRDHYLDFFLFTS